MDSRIVILREGAVILESLLIPSGFTFAVGDSGSSSGGPFAEGSWSNGRRKLSVSVRFSLGLVQYRYGLRVEDHMDFMWAISGKRHGFSYPGISEDPLDGFRHLHDDLSRYGEIFISGKDAELKKIFCKARELRKYWENLSPLKRLEVE